MTFKLILKHAVFQTKTTLIHPEQILLLFGTPIVLLLIFQNKPAIFAFTLATCALASNFTSNTITMAFARRYGSLKYLAVTPLGLNGYIFGQSLSGTFTLLLQAPVAYLLASYLNLEIRFDLYVLIGLIALVFLFTQWAFLFASLMSAEKVLAFANIFFIGLVASGFFALESPLASVHPLGGLNSFASLNSSYLVIIFSLNLISYLLLKKVFKWLE